nr:unnamed protein product [Digitaria exilis]
MLRMGMLILFLLSVVRHGCAQSYNAIFSFGHSISDTGNLCTGSGGCPSWLTTGQAVREHPLRAPHRPHFGLPLLPPSKASGGDFKKGANMVIIGATTMDFEFFKSHGLGNSIWNNGALGTQIQWFQQLMPSICGSDCRTYLNSSLFVVGEFGGNDYNAPLFGGKNVRTYAPQIIDKITSSVDALIELGATELVVPGVLPIGCFPLYLPLYPSSNKDDYDEIGCLKSFNNLSGYHNNLLKQAVSGLQSKHAGVRLMYADFYAQVVDMGSYNYNNRAWCGMSGSSACGDPEKHLVWDGIHLTDAAYHAVADGWLNGTYCSPGILH